MKNKYLFIIILAIFSILFIVGCSTNPVNTNTNTTTEITQPNKIDINELKQNIDKVNTQVIKNIELIKSKYCTLPDAERTTIHKVIVSGVLTALKLPAIYGDLIPKYDCSSVNTTSTIN